MRAPAPLLAVAIAACGGGSSTAIDAAAPPDMAAPGGTDITGRWAAALDVDLGGDGGASMALRIYSVFTAFQPGADSPVSTQWYLCSLPIPNFLDVPYKSLARAGAASATGSVSDGKYAQPPVAFVMGAQLADPAHDPLPTDPTHLCASTTDTGCVIPDEITGQPGAAIAVHGLVRDVDLVYAVARLRWSFEAGVDGSDALAGSADDVDAELHVLACRLRDGSACSAADVAAIEASHGGIARSTGTLRAHEQGGYFSCPQLLAAPDDSLSGAEPMPSPDAGVVAAPTFQANVQTDLDRMGCATGGCHETILPPKLHLVFMPDTMSDLMANYQAVLPYTTGDPQPGGRFVNEVPLPDDMRDRWLKWESDGTPF